jgi:hypothetical protein
MLGFLNVVSSPHRCINHLQACRAGAFARLLSFSATPEARATGHAINRSTEILKMPARLKIVGSTLESRIKKLGISKYRFKKYSDSPAIS